MVVNKMAEAVSEEEASFTCPVCLYLLKDPVTTACGHDFCMRCINDCWDQEDVCGVYSCPICKHNFTTRPVLTENPVIAEFMDKLTMSSVAAASADVECDICTGIKLKAVKSCLHCLLSYCETHYKDHSDIDAGTTHSVIDAIGQLQERICPRHQKFFNVFCRTDQSCICSACVDDHKGHDTVTAAGERTDKQVSLLMPRSKRRPNQNIVCCEQFDYLMKNDVHKLKKCYEAGFKGLNQLNLILFTVTIITCKRCKRLFIHKSYNDHDVSSEVEEQSSMEILSSPTTKQPVNPQQKLALLHTMFCFCFGSFWFDLKVSFSHTAFNFISISDM